MNHTPGPWSYVEKFNVGFSNDYWIRDRGGFGICELDEKRKESEANAKLIAAAPELLEALEALHACHRAFSSSENWTSLDDDAREFAESIIAKAKGEK